MVQYVHMQTPFLKYRAFTLIELMVTIAIIGILSAIIVPNFTSSQAKARDAKRVSDIAQLQLALERYFDRCGEYPIPDNGLPKQLSKDLTNTVCDSKGINLGSFIDKIPTPPSNSPTNYYTYTVPPEPISGLGCIGTDYHLGVLLETTNSSLQEASHFNSTDDPNAGSTSQWCQGGFDASSNPLWYDVRPK